MRESHLFTTATDEPMAIPRDLDEAAKLNGASLFGIYWRIILPLSLPVHGIIPIFTATNH